MHLQELTPREVLLLEACRRLGVLWPTRRAACAVGATFALNTVAMAASSGLRSPELWIVSALQAGPVTALCFAPGVLVSVLGTTHRWDHRRSVVAALFIACANVASAVVSGW